MKRDFKGVWIPADLWLDSSIKPIHKFFILEIDSFSKKGSCFASNAHFAELFGLSKRQVSRIIGDMVKQKIITLHLKYEGKEVISRTLKAIRYHDTSDTLPIDTIVHTPHDKSGIDPHDRSGACTIPIKELYPRDIKLPNDIDPELWEEWLSLRKRKKAVNTHRSLTGLLNKLTKCAEAGYSRNHAITTALEEEWKSINPDWITNLDSKHDDKRTRSQRGHDNLMELCGSAYSDSDDGGSDIFDVLPDVGRSLESQTGHGQAHVESNEESLDAEDARFHNASRVSGYQRSDH